MFLNLIICFLQKFPLKNLKRRNLLDDNGFKEYPLILISNMKEVKEKLKELQTFIQTLHIEQH